MPPLLKLLQLTLIFFFGSKKSGIEDFEANLREGCLPLAKIRHRSSIAFFPPTIFRISSNFVRRQNRKNCRQTTLSHASSQIRAKSRLLRQLLDFVSLNESSAITGCNHITPPLTHDMFSNGYIWRV